MKNQPDANGHAQHIEGRSVSKSTYTNHGCRCDGCTEQMSEAMREYRSRRPVAHRRAVLTQRIFMQLCVDAISELPEIRADIYAEAKLRAEERLLAEGKKAAA